MGKETPIIQAFNKRCPFWVIIQKKTVTWYPKLISPALPGIHRQNRGFYFLKRNLWKWYISKHNSCHWFSVKFVYVRPQGRLPCGAFREQRKYPTGTMKYPLSAWDLTEHTSHRVQLVLWQGRQKRSWKDLKISIFICWDTHSPVICSPMVQHQRMCRNCLDTLT